MPKIVSAIPRLETVYDDAWNVMQWRLLRVGSTAICPFEVPSVQAQEQAQQ